MHCVLNGFFPGFSGCRPGETRDDPPQENQAPDSRRGRYSGSSGFSGSSGDIKECGSGPLYYLKLLNRGYATREDDPAHIAIALLLHPEQPEQPEKLLALVLCVPVSKARSISASELTRRTGDRR